MAKTNRRKALIAAAILIAAAAIGYRYFRGQASLAETASARRGTITQTVIVTGKTRSPRDVELAFEKTGRISAVFVAVGSRVGPGEALATIDRSELETQLAKARADFEAEGAEIARAQVALANSLSGVRDVLNEARTSAEGAVQRKADTMFSSVESDSPTLNFPTYDSIAKGQAEIGRIAARRELAAWAEELRALNASANPWPAELEAALTSARNRIGIIRVFLSRTADAMTSAYGLSATTLETYRTNVLDAQAAINAAATKVSAQEQSIAKDQAGVAAETAAQKSFEASIRNIEAQIAKTILTSPIAGIVARQDAKVGEIAVASTPLVSVISAGALDIEANVPEADVAKIEVGDPATAEFDALSGERFPAKVTRIDPAEEVIEGVATYRTLIALEGAEPRLRPGMTADVAITAATRKSAIIVPQRAVVTRNGGAFVRLLESKAIREVPVTIGLRGSDGTIEITSGLSGGEEVVTFLREAER